jgi:hypothetical protein
MEIPSQTLRRLWQISALAFTAALLGAIILFNPTLEFAAVDLIEKLHLPIGPIGNIALYAELTLFTTSTLGLITLTLRHILKRRSL